MSALQGVLCTYSTAPERVAPSNRKTLPMRDTGEGHADQTGMIDVRRQEDLLISCLSTGVSTEADQHLGEALWL